MNALVISKSLFFLVTLFFWTAQSLYFGLYSPFSLDCLVPLLWTVQSKVAKVVGNRYWSLVIRRSFAG